MSEYKQIIIVRNDLKLPKGKMAAQAAHASVEAVLRSDKDLVKRWRMVGMGKIVLRVESLEELYALEQEAKKLGFTTAVISDAGKTVVEPGTVTCMAIGPDLNSKIDKITGNLKMM